MTEKSGSVVLCVMALSATCVAAPVELYVSPGGSDGSPGTREKPFASLEVARDAARKIKGGPRRIVVMPGDYFLHKTLVLDPRDNGLSIEADERGKATLYGGTLVSGWRRDGDRFWCADLPGVKEGAWDFRALVVNGRLAERARLPESGTFLHRSVWTGARYISGNWDPKPTREQLTTMLYDPKDIPATLDVRNAEIRVYSMWLEALCGVARNDTPRHALVLSSPTLHPPGAWGVKKYVIFNTREGMFRPGQWYLDRTAGRVVYWPLPDEDLARAKVVAPRIERIIHLAGKKNKAVKKLTIRGLTLQATTTPLGSGGFCSHQFDGALRFEWTRQCTAEGLEICNVGGQGVVLTSWNEACRIADCHVHHAGACGIKITGSGAGPLVSGNHIHHLGVHYPSAVAFYGEHHHPKGLRIYRNEIHDGPYSGIVCFGANHRIEENLIYRVMREMHDGAAIYGHLTRGLLRGNVVRDVVKAGKGFGAAAYYLDEQSEDCLVERNVSIGVARPMQNHITRDITMRHNVFIAEGDMALPCSRSANLAFEGNTLFAPGKLTVMPPSAVKLWKDNVVFRRGLAASGVAQPFTIDDAMPSVPAPERRPYAASVDWADRPPTLDGEVGAEAWPGQGLSLSRAPSRWNASGLPVSAELSHDSRCLYVAVVVGVYRMSKLRKGTAWGQDDGAEVAIAGKTPDGKPATFVVRGYPTGAVQSVTDAGAPADAAARLAKAVRFAAKTWRQGWRGEWAIPFDALGLKPEPGLKAAFNLAVYRNEDAVWRCWEGTLAESWRVGQAGLLQLGRPRPVAHAKTAPAPTMDGAVASSEWGPAAATFGPGQAVTLWLRHDREALYVAFRNKVDPAKPLKTEPRWHTNDAVEVALRTAADAPIAVLRGYPKGQFESSTEAGAPMAFADAVAKATSYAACVVSAAEWTAEWRIPFSALNPAIAPGAKLQANFTLHRLANGSEYICWRRVGRRSSWELAHAGMLIVE